MSRLCCASIKRFIPILMIAVSLAFNGKALARPNIRSAFFAEYPSAVGSVLDSVPSRSNHCGLCHFSFTGGGALNPYGALVGSALPSFPSTTTGRRQAIQSIENDDADGDLFSSLIEITDVSTFSNTPTFPGLTSGNVAAVSNVSITDLQDYLTPTAGGDTTPPDVTLISPNGGDNLTANAPTTVQWTATDASGVSGVNLYLSEDDGGTYRLIAQNLTNTGTYSWYPANRPGAEMRVRVEATDNAQNTNHDDSNSVFTIDSPPGGLAPTTLRDFDQPGTQPFEGGMPLNAPSVCAVCHGNYNSTVEPYYNWQGSMMAHASRDLLFEAGMTIGNQDAPDSGDLCLRCHIPNGWLQGRSVPTDGSRMLATDKVGVSCDMCHRLVDPVYSPGENPSEDAGILAALSMPGSEFGNGMAVIDPTGTRRGPFVDATSGHTVLVSAFHREAAICGTCHDVSNTAFQNDGAGNFVPNNFDESAPTFSAHSLLPIERTYSEWFYSDYNTAQGVFAPEFGGNKDFVASCQDCHMRDVTGKGCSLPSAPTRSDLPLHDMTGGSTWLPGLLSAMFPGEVNDAALQAGIARARYMLQNAAQLAAEQDGAQLKVTVTNNTGHKLPTGYPEGRRVWINVKYFDDGMTLLGESGAYNAGTGELTHDAAIKIYETKPGLDAVTAGLVGVDPGPSFHFVLNNKIYKDNRIPPRGFANAAYDQFGGTPVGATYADGQYWDDTFYTPPAGATSAQVTLYYQSTSKEFVEFLRDANTTNTKGQEMYDLWNNNGKCPPEVMAQLTIPLDLVIVGDIDGDGDVDETDLGFFAGVLVGTDLDAEHVARSDINADSAADGLDVQGFVGALLAG
ncbi:MAG: hypothetical protein H6818_08700 [Phycisphaerales bacterium]|nr:hypothetical protein [Phycisphaerales bacterium]MCB9862649.1 hypothetical protein [Phycisphaerales bacterium]